MEFNQQSGYFNINMSHCLLSTLHYSQVHPDGLVWWPLTGYAGNDKDRQSEHKITPSEKGTNITVQPSVKVKENQLNAYKTKVSKKLSQWRTMKYHSTACWRVSQITCWMRGQTVLNINQASPLSLHINACTDTISWGHTTSANCWMLTIYAKIPNSNDTFQTILDAT